MPSTYTTNLKLELIPTGAQSGVWGVTTNANMGSSSATQSGLEQAIVGTATCVTADFTSNVATYTLTDTNASQTARAFCLNVTATLTAAGTINVPAIQKPYLVFNNSVGGFAVTVKVSGQTGVSIPNGKKAWLYNNGTDVGVAFDYAPSLVLGTPLLPASGGTGLSSLGTGVATFLGTPSSANLAAAVTDETGSGALVFANTPTLVTPLLGTPTSATLTNATGLPISTGVSGLGAGVATFLATPSSANLASAVTDETGTGSLVFANSPTLVTPNLGVPSFATLTSATGLPLSTGVTGTLAVANGGTGQTSFTDGQLLIGNSTGNTLTKTTLTAGSGVTITNGSGAITVAFTGPGAGSVTSVDVSGGTTGLTTSGGPIISSGTVTLAGTLIAANGGTGLTASGSLGNVLTSNGTTWTSSAPAAGGITYTVTKTANYTAVANDGVLTNTTAGAFTVTLPASPSNGDQVIVADAGGTWGTNNLTVGRNGNNIADVAQDLVCDISGVSVQFVYNSSGTPTWEVYAQVGGNGGTVVTLDGVQTLTNKTISGASNTFTNIPLTTGVTGTLPVTNGGTGQTSFTNGQLLIGNTTGNTLTKAALTAGAGVSITNGSGSITIAASGGAGSNLFLAYNFGGF